MRARLPRICASNCRAPLWVPDVSKLCHPPVRPIHVESAAEGEVAMRPLPGTARQRGFALLIVLWSMALLALIGTRITAAGRAGAQLATNLRASAIAEAAADGAVFEALFHFMDSSDGHWPVDGLV